MADEPVPATEPTIAVFGAIPNADGPVEGTIRISALIDLTFVDGKLDSISFDAVQYTVFEALNQLAVRMAFPGK